MAGIIEVLAVGKGHGELKLPDDAQAAKAQVDDLKRKGYLITVNHEGKDLKVDDFDGTTGEYICRTTISETKEIRIPAATSKATAVPPISGG